MRRLARRSGRPWKSPEVITGYRVARPERLPLGRPGERPQGRGARTPGRAALHKERKRALDPCGHAFASWLGTGKAPLPIGQHTPPGPAAGLLSACTGGRTRGATTS
jgi:hypothetical protein